jgi:outer membrane protein insertion porin family
MTRATSRFLLRLFVSGLLVFGLPSCGLAQMVQKPISKMPASAQKLIAIKVTGSKRFPEAAIAAVTGLPLGTAVTEDDFKTAARRLGETGAFSDIGYTYSYSAAGTRLELQVTDAERFVPAQFEDFVWFSDSEIRRRVQEHVPLFDGELPLSGSMADHVSDVLQAMLVESGVSGHVNYERKGKPDGPVESIVYSVSDILIRVRNIEFTGVAAADLPALESAAQAFSGREYSRTRLDTFVQRQILPVYYARGYMKAVCGEPQAKVVKEPAAETEEGPRNQTVVDVTFAVTPGAQYKLKGLEWSGNHEFSTEKLEKMIRAEPGKPANTVRLTEELQAVRTLYGSRGFITAAIKPQADFDDAAGTVAIRLEVTEGPVYHMGDLELRGVGNSLTAKLRDLWKLRQGDVYDSTYLDSYVPEARKILPTRLDWEISPHATANIRDKTVDVDIIFSVKSPS